MKITDIKDYEYFNTCYDESININGKDIKEYSKDDLLEFINDMLNNDLNKENLLFDIIKLTLDYTQADCIDDNSNICDQCGSFNSYS